MPESNSIVIVREPATGLALESNSREGSSRRPSMNLPRLQFSPNDEHRGLWPGASETRRAPAARAEDRGRHCHDPVHDLRAARGIVFAIFGGAACWSVMATIAYWLLG